MTKKWWQPKNDRGPFHAVQNIITEAIRRLLSALHANPSIRGRDLAYWLAHALTALALAYILFTVAASFNRPASENSMIEKTETTQQENVVTTGPDQPTRTTKQ